MHSDRDPIMWAVANPKIGEREVLTAMLEVDADPVARREASCSPRTRDSRPGRSKQTS